MTAFEDAAHAEVERRSPTIDHRPDDFTYPRAALREHKCSAFEAGALWARDHLAEQEPTDVEVEALTIALSRRLYLMGGPEPSWSEMGEDERDAWRGTVRSAITEARKGQAQ